MIYEPNGGTWVDIAGHTQAIENSLSIYKNGKISFFTIDDIRYGMKVLRVWSFSSNVSDTSKQLTDKSNGTSLKECYVLKMG